MFNNALRLTLWFAIFLVSGCGTGGSSPSISSVPVYNPVQVKAPQSLCIFYGIPSLINNTVPVYARDETGTVYDVDVRAAVNEFAQCQLVVLGDDLSDPTNSDYYATQLVVYGLAEKGIALFGYVDAGVITQNLTLAQADTKIKQWQAMGVDGIFLDDFGFDFGITRSRQNSFLTLVHSKNLKAFVNAFNPKDVFDDKNEQNNTELPLLAAGDIYLAENWLYESGQYTSLALWYEKTVQLHTYLPKYGVLLAATATKANQQATAYDYQSSSWQYAYWGSVLQGADYFQWTDNGFSADASVLYHYPVPNNVPVSMAFVAPISASSDKLTYSRTLSTGKLSISGDSKAYGSYTLQ